MKKIIVVVIIAAVVVGGVIVYAGGGKKSNDNATAPATSSNKNSTSQTTAQTATPVTKDGTETVTVDANDQRATPDTINVKQGDKIIITFNVLKDGTYHGGLEFKSTDPPIESDPILPGSTGDVTFTATKSFQFTPYWYQSGVRKDYVVSVNVQ